MKGKKILLIFLLAVVAVLMLHPVADAVERNFGKGSLIIPMDSVYQPSGDGGLLEAYGLAYSLLKHKDAEGHNDITVYWIINMEKTTITGIDFEIMVKDSGILTKYGTTAVSKLYNHAGGTSALTYRTGDSNIKVSYLGGPFIVDEEDAATAKTIINLSGWSAVNVHEAQVPFAAPVCREMRGTPPRIALMNDSEKDKGNASILEAYLRLAGICTDVYDVVTPLQVKNGILETQDYDFLWAPHWDGYKNYPVDADAIIAEVREFVDNGNALFAECCSIEVFEHSKNGRFLSNKSFGHNGGTNKEEDIIYNDVTAPNSQIGDFSFVPEGGHLHNWRPFVFGDPYNIKDEEPDVLPAGSPEVTLGNPSVYNATVSRFTIDNTGWDYYVGGYMDGDTEKGYVVYLGGHKYASCGNKADADPELHVHGLDLEFKKDITTEVITLLVSYNSGLSTTVTFSKANLTAKTGNPLEMDVTEASVNKKKVLDIILRNKGTSAITVNSITVSWTGGPVDQRICLLVDTKTDKEYYKNKDGSKSGKVISTPDFTISALESYSDATCTNNTDCQPANIAGVRYVLNTLFNIKFVITSREYVRAAPVNSFPYLYQGSFEYPSYYGHFRRYNVTSALAEKTYDWDTADGGILNANTGNADGRKIYTAKQGYGIWTKLNFDAANIGELRVPLSVTPANGDDSDEIKVITRVRGKTWVNDAWVESSNKLGGIMHSAPVIVEPNSRLPNRRETAYVGDLYGMLHAIDTETGEEKWAFIPRNLLGKLKNDRTDNQAVQDFAAVDASPTAKDIYLDHDNNPDTDGQWKTILVCPEGNGGRHLFALDVTSPTEFSVLWEVTDMDAPGGGMGHSCRASLNKVKWPITDDVGNITGYRQRWVVFVAAGFANIIHEHGGINAYAFDLLTGEKLWNFSAEYSDSVNDIPGAITLFDIDGDNFVDHVYFGDMNGRIWELDAITGTNPSGRENLVEIPLWNCGVGNPISVSPAITKIGGDVILLFGTGGTDWASDDRSYALFAVNATTKKETPTVAEGSGTLKWRVDLAVGEKVWSAPSIAAGQLYVATSFGSMESSSPRDDVALSAGNTGNLYSINLSTGEKTWTISDVGKIRGAVFVERQHIYATTINNTIIQIGGEDFTAGSADNVILMNWREI